jgi:hypothetical protein
MIFAGEFTMELNARLIITAILASVGGLGAWYMTGEYNQIVFQQIEEIENAGQVDWNAETGASLLQEGESHLAESAKLLQTGSFEEAQYAYDRFLRVIDPYFYSYGDQSLPNGIALTEWVEQQKLEHAERVRNTYDMTLEELQLGRTTHDRMIALCKYSPISDELFDRYRAAEDQVASARAVLARNWFRLTFSGNTDRYRDRVVEVLRGLWSNRYGIELVEGRPVNRIEENSTWASIDVRISHQHAQYELIDASSKGKWVNWHPPQIPHTAKLEFEIRKADGVPTSWDILAAITVSTDVPETITQKDADGHHQRIASELVNLAAAGLAVTPAFELFPGTDLSTLSLVKDGKIDAEAARALKFLDPDRLMLESEELIASGDEDLKGDLLRMLIAVDLEDRAPWIAEQIESGDDRMHRAIYEELKKKPWFGHHLPLIALIRFGDEFPYYGLETLRGQLTVPGVRNAVLDKVMNGTGSVRGNYSSVFLTGLARESVSEYASWIRDDDGDFAVSVFNIIHQKNPELALQLAYAEFESVQPRVREWMLKLLDPADEERGDAAIQILVGAATQDAHEGLRRSARAKILKICYVPKAWDALRKLADQEQDPMQRNEMEQRLLYNVKRAHPDTARGYLLTEMYSEDPAVRDAAIGQLVGGDDPKEEIIREVYLLVLLVSDPEFTRNVLMNMHQSAKLRRGWDFEQPELIEIVKMGLAHSDPSARGFSYEILGAGMRKGQQSFKDALVDALSNETEPSQRRTLERLLKT